MQSDGKNSLGYVIMNSFDNEDKDNILDKTY